jgi:hypothetical protein
MNAADLMTKLIEIERASDSAGLTRLRSLALDAQQDFLQLEQQLMESLLENQRLLECLEMGAYGFDSGTDLSLAADEGIDLRRGSARFAAERTPRKLGPYWIN